MMFQCVDDALGQIRGHNYPVKPSVRLVCLQLTLAAVVEFWTKNFRSSESFFLNTESYIWCACVVSCCAGGI